LGTERDSLIPVNSPLLKKLNMSKEEQREIWAIEQLFALIIDGK
jgi:hypothetical protein